MSALCRIAANSMTCLGSGVFGLTHVLCSGNATNMVKFLSYSGLVAAVLYSTLRKWRTREPNERDMILITGCDSGLG